MIARDAATEADPTDAVEPDDVATEQPDAATTDTPVTTDTATTNTATTATASAAETADDHVEPAEADDPTPATPATPAKAPKPGKPAKAERRRRERKAADDDGTADTTADRPGPRRRTRWIVGVLLLVSVLFAGAMAGLYVANRPAPIAGLTSTQQSAVDAATQAAINLQTFRRASFDQDFANALASLTPDFAQQQLAPRKDALEQQLKDGGRDASATALSAGLVSSTSTQAVVLVVTNTTQTADDGTSTPFVFSRLQLTLDRVDGKWLVSDLKSVGLS